MFGPAKNKYQLELLRECPVKVNATAMTTTTLQLQREYTPTRVH